MAVQNKKSTAGGRRGTTKKSSSSGKRTTGRNNNKESQGPDLLTIVVVLVAIVLVFVLVSKYSKEKKEGEVLPSTGGETVTLTPEPSTPRPGDITSTPLPTAAVTRAPQPEATDTPAPTPTKEPGLTESEARNIVKKIVQLDKYGIELLDDHLMIEGAEYYTFCINDENGESMAPLLIVEKTKGTLLCYDMSGVVAPVEKFPLDKTETGNEGTRILSEEEAKKVLTGYSGAALGLAKEPAAYEMTVDDWTTNAGGADCYGFNLFETVNDKQRFRGTFYVALDGSAVYSKDEVTGEFIKR